MKVSIVICAYNEEEKLPRCIDSVIAQTFSNWELWVINDGSTDSTAKLVQQYAEQDHRIHLHSQENQGLSSARKSGIRCAQGEYLTFIDADDYVGEQYLEHLLEGQTLYPNVDCIIGGYRYSETNSQPPSDDFCISSTFLATEHPRHFLMLWSKLWKTSFMKQYVDLIPNGLNYMEDYTTSYLLYPHINNIAFVPYTDYYYICQTNRMSTKVVPPDEILRIYNLVIPALQHPFWDNSTKGKRMQSHSLVMAIAQIIKGTTSHQAQKEYIKQLPTLKMPKISYIKDYKLGVLFCQLLFRLKCYSLLLYLLRKVLNISSPQEE